MSLLPGEYIIMLKKKVCKKCRGEFKPLGWIEVDEIRWKEGFVICPLQFSVRENNVRSIIAQPPSKCPYFLESTI